MFTDLILILLTLLIILIGVVSLSILYSTWRYGIPPVPTSRKRIQQMIDLADIKSGMKIYDLGCGDGRILRAVSHQLSTGVDPGAVKLIGVEGNPTIAWIAKILNLLTRDSTPPHQQIEILQGDFFKIDLSQADVIFCYLRPTIMKPIKTKIWPHLKGGCQIISHSFSLEFEEAKSLEVSKGVKIYKYVKP